MLRPQKHHWDRRGQSRTAVGHNELQITSVQAAIVEIPQQTLPGGLAFPRTALKRQQFPCPVRFHSVGH